ncbi:hypothetical protein BMF94_2329 [Rhodotorula taiwanensis]|uniref:DUF7729 domain-containing protein n=1 Tax=Rhodotorula taiwanensis TaxID=741276 RepID=A0A2S5BCT3_9BASI|nr:hypothetical protein BMF94_2329 [Rhodotorula taiwanensis]
MLARSALVAAAVLSSVATAQSASDLLSGISSTCTSSVSNLLGSQFASCADISGLIPILTTSGSVVTPSAFANSWLGTLCGQSNCSTSAIQNATGIIDAGCSAELSAGNAVVTVARTAIANFNTVKAAACLQQSSNSTYCVTDLLDKVQSGLNTQLTVSSLTSLSLSDLEKIPSSEVCDDCAHALTTKLLPVIESATTSSSAAGASGVSSSSISSAIGGYCGQSFLDGQVPSDIKQGSGSSSSSSSSGNGAVSSTSLTGGAELSTGSWSKVAGVAGVGLAAAVMLV